MSVVDKWSVVNVTFCWHILFPTFGRKTCKVIMWRLWQLLWWLAYVFIYFTWFTLKHFQPHMQSFKRLHSIFQFNLSSIFWRLFRPGPHHIFIMTDCVVVREKYYTMSLKKRLRYCYNFSNKYALINWIWNLSSTAPVLRMKPKTATVKKWNQVIFVLWEKIA